MNTNHMPSIIYQHMAKHHIQQFAPAWIKLEYDTATIKEVGGDWQHYFHKQPEIGSELHASCEILFGMLPITESFELPQVQLIQNQYTDISGIRHQNTDWVLFSDVTAHTLQMQQYQQASNELVLLKGQLKRTLNRYVGEEVLDRISKGDLQFDVAGERKLISTLFVDIRGFTPFNERHDAQVVMQTLNDYMDCMLPPILNEAGMIDKIMGDGAMAVFGVLSSDKEAVYNAFTAAKHILSSVKKLNQVRHSHDLEQLGVGIGIATGEAVLGILGSHDRRCFTAIGSHVNLASRLESTARVGEILVDAKSHQLLGEALIPTQLELKGIGKVTAYSCLHDILVYQYDI